MFTTYPDYEAPLHAAFSSNGQRLWRAVQVSSLAHWFLLTLEEHREDPPRQESVLLAWDTVLVELLENLEGVKPISLLCMVPTRRSPTASWRAREVRDIWIGTRASGERAIFFRDPAGDEFGDGLDGQHVAPLVCRRQFMTLGS